MNDWSAHAARLRASIERRRAEMLADLARYVAIPTGFNHAPGLDEFRGLLCERLARLGAQVELVPGDARPSWLDEDGRAFVPPVTAVCRRLVPGLPRVLLAGHLDTVFEPTGSFRSLVIAPDGQRAVGPGVVDMKGGILIAVVALEAMEELGLRTSWTFVLNSDEETGSFASDRTLRREAAGHDAGLAFEPALPDGSLAIARKGSGQFMIDVRGRAAHAGRDFEKGVSAVYALGEVLGRLAGLSDLARGLTVNVGPLRGGSATNIVPDRAMAWGNVRFNDADGAAELARELDRLTTAPRVLPGIVVHRALNRPAKPTLPGTERLALLARSVAEGLGQRLPFASTGGVCDGNNLQAAGLPTIDSMGVRGGGLHTEQEWIELASLTERATLVACLIDAISAGAIAERPVK